MRFKINPFLLASGLVASLSNPTVHATDIAWDTNLGAGPWDWNTGANWTGGTAPTIRTDRANLKKDWTAAAVINLSAPTITNGILFDDTGASGDVGLTIGNGGNAANTLTLAGTAPVIEVTGALGISAVIAGNTNWTKTGGGTLTLSGANTYSGNTTISSTGDTIGILVNNSSALGTGAVLVNGGQNFSHSLSVASGLTVTNALTLKRGNGGSNRAILGLGASSTWSGNITVDNTSGSGIAVISGNGTTAATASIVSGNIGFTTLGTGTASSPTLVLRSNTGKVTGSIALSTGYLQMTDGSKWEFSNASNTWGTLDINNVNAIATVGATNTLSASGIVTSTAGGTLQLNNQAGTTAYNQSIAGLGGNVKVGLGTGAATLTLNNATDLTSSGAITGAIALVKSGAAVQSLSGTNTYSGGTNVNAGALSLLNTNAKTGTINVAAGATLGLGVSGANAFTLANVDSLFDNTLANVTMNATSLAGIDTTNGDFSYGSSASGTRGLNKLGINKLTLTASNTYSGGTIVTGGTLALGHATDTLADGGAVNVNGGTLDLGANTDTVGAVTLNSGSITGAGTLTGSSYAVLSGAISGNLGGGASLTKSSGGTVTLSGASNSYAGGTTISGGVLQANASGALGSGAVAISGGQRLSLGNGVTLNNAITINNNSGAQGAGLLEASSAVTGSATLGGPITINNSPAGGGHFANSGTGAFNVNGAITSSVTVVHRNGRVTYAGGGSYTNMDVTGTAALGAHNGLATNAKVNLGVSGAGSLDLAGYNQSLAGITKAANAATIGNSSTTVDSVLTITGTSTYGGVIQNTLGAGTMKTGLTVNGGALTLSGTSSYTGATTVSAGTLLVSGILGNTAVSVSSAGTVGGTGALGGSLHFDTGATLTIVDISDALSITGNVNFDGFGFDDISGWDYSNAAEGTYTLLAGPSGNFDLTNVSNVGEENALNFGNGKYGYFQNGSLQVVIIPEPSTAALLGGMGLLVLLRRRRAR